MGWDVTPVGRNITTKKFIEHYIKTSYDGVYTAIKICEGKNKFGEKAFYVALKKLEDNTVFGVVFLTRRKNGSVAVKVIGESSGPRMGESMESRLHQSLHLNKDTKRGGRINGLHTLLDNQGTNRF